MDEKKSALRKQTANVGVDGLVSVERTPVGVMTETIAEEATDGKPPGQLKLFWRGDEDEEVMAWIPVQ